MNWLHSQARKHPDIVEIKKVVKEVLGIPDSPSVSDEEGESESSEFCETGATGGAPVTSPKKKSKGSKVIILQ